MRKGAKPAGFGWGFSLRLCAFAGACFYLSAAAPVTQRPPKREPYGPPATIATLKDKSISESSGLAASRLTPGAYWTHNDSGDGPFLYAFDTRGESFGVFRVAGAQARDWEDMAAGPGPTGGKAGRISIWATSVTTTTRAWKSSVYRVPEPALTTATRKFTKSKPGTTEPAEAIRLRYPDGAHDAETLLVHPVSGHIYIITKVVIANPAVYEAAPPFTAGKPITMTPLGLVNVPESFWRHHHRGQHLSRRSPRCAMRLLSGLRVNVAPQCKLQRHLETKNGQLRSRQAQAGRSHHLPSRRQSPTRHK